MTPAQEQRLEQLERATYALTKRERAELKKLLIEHRESEARKELLTKLVKSTG